MKIIAMSGLKSAKAHWNRPSASWRAIAPEAHYHEWGFWDGSKYERRALRLNISGHEVLFRGPVNLTDGEE